MRALAVVALLLVAACTPAGPSASAPAEAEPAGPILAAAPISREEEETARQLYQQAQVALAADRLREAEAAAGRVVDQYPSSRVSVAALWLRAQVRAQGDGPVDTAGDVPAAAGADPERDARLQGAQQDLERLVRVLPAGDERVAPALLTLARVQAARGDAAAGLRTALTLPQGARQPEESMVAWARRTAITLTAQELERVLDGADPGQPLRIPVLVAYARSLRLAGDEDGARRFARSALDAGAAGTDMETARALVEGRRLPLDGAGPVPVGLVLPLGGSPAFQVFAREIQEGVETALEAWGLTDDVELLILDDGGDIPTAANLVRSAEARGAVAILGLLEESTLAAATRSRVAIPLISPTAWEVPTDAPGVFSLNAFDPGAAEALAEWAADSGIRQVAIIHASRGASARDAQLFSERFQARGGSVLRTFPYEPGVTFWESQIKAAAALRPEALVLPVPPEDLPGMAPQVTFFGLDTLGIRILGTGAWTDPQILGDVDPRHTNGVVAATPVRSLPDSEGYRRFREAYERRFRRSLVDGAVQALGYDAASLVFRGIFAGAGRPQEVAAALAQVRDLQGATGSLSVVDGELRRLHHLVCLQDGTQHPIQAGDLPTQLYRPHQRDEATGEIPEGPGRPNGFACPLPLDTVMGRDTLSLHTP